MRMVLITVVAGLLAYLAFACGMQRRVLYPSPPASPEPPLPPGVEVVWLGSERDVEAWYLAPHSPDPAPALIFTHGNGELIDHWVEAFEVPRSWGVAVLLVEYPGYGRSGGRPSEQSITATMLDAYDFLAGRAEVDARRIVAYGRSLGGGAACALASRRPVAALILESTFTSVRTMAASFGIPGPLVLDRYENAEVVLRFEGPILVLHGERDRIIPVSHGRALAEAAGVELVLLPCGHNDCPRPWTAIRSFLRAHRLLADPAVGGEDRSAKGP